MHLRLRSSLVTIRQQIHTYSLSEATYEVWPIHEACAAPGSVLCQLSPSYITSILLPHTAAVASLVLLHLLVGVSPAQTSKLRPAFHASAGTEFL